MERLSLFLSAAEEDGEAGREIYDWLIHQGFNVYYWQDRQGGLFIREIEKAINEADAFIALISPHFLASTWCNNERELAILREQDLQAKQPERVFINVLNIAETPYAETGFLRRYAWTNLMVAETKDRELEGLATGLKAISPVPTSGATILGEVASLFRNREDELEKVSRGITNAAGPHFWLVIAPPQLGKTWFLNRLSADVAKGQREGVAKEQSASALQDGEINQESADVARQTDESKPWVIRLVDIREQPPEVREDPAAILALLFGRTERTAANGDADDIAGEICAAGSPHLCLLDSAELLHEDAAKALRSFLGSIYRSIQGAGTPDYVRLAVVVASRREYEWCGVAPEPRLSALPLTEFGIDIVQGALRHLAQQMGRENFSPTDYRQNASFAYRLSEGLPALLVQCLQWIQHKQWVNIERLDRAEAFEDIAHPYIKAELLSFESLFPWSRESAVPTTGEMQRVVLEEAFRALAPYRLFTQSHLRHYIDSSPDFGRSLEELNWSLEDLWQSISDTALLRRPLREVWQELHEAIRRLMFRYYYSSSVQRADAHRDARGFMQVWVDKQAGKEQVMGLVECLWHEACELRLRESTDMARILSESAKKLSTALAPSSAYSKSEVRNFAANVIRNDEELQEALGQIDGLGDLLATIVAAPL